MVYASLRQRLFGISPNETSFERRGFAPTEPVVQQHLQTAGKNFVDGYNAALATANPSELTACLDKTDTMFRGFAFEGAAMALALLDLVTPWNRRRFDRFLNSSSGDAHWYMLYIGAGWAIARIPWARRNFERAIAGYSPLYRWLALDGYGFHEGFFHYRKYVEQQATCPRLSPPAAQVFDQGLGRSFWFSHGGNPARIADRIAAFPISRRGDLWSGAGLAASYAGGVKSERVVEIRDRAENYCPHLAQGAVFAAKARQRAGNQVPHTELACAIFCQMSADEAAAISDDCLNDLPAGGAEPAYQVWRARIRERFQGGRAATGPMLSAVQAPIAGPFAAES